MIKHFDQILELKTIRPDGFFSGYASVFDTVDQHREVIQKGAFQRSLSKWARKGGLPKMLWQHDMETPIGIWREITEDDHGLYVSGQLLLGVQKGLEAYCLLKSGAVDSLSIGFKTVRSIKEPRRNVRHIQEVDLYEISLVTFAANSDAKVTFYKRNDPQDQLIVAKLNNLEKIIRS